MLILELSSKLETCCGWWQRKMTSRSQTLPISDLGKASRPPWSSLRPKKKNQGGSNITVKLSDNKTYVFDYTVSLGEGGQGSVFEAKAEDGSLIALKIAPKKESRVQDREYDNLKNINHPNLDLKASLCLLTYFPWASFFSRWFPDTFPLEMSRV